MTTDMKLKMLKSMTDEEDKDVLSTYLSLAEKVVLQRAYPYENVSKVPMKYDAVHVDPAWQRKASRDASEKSTTRFPRRAAP